METDTSTNRWLAAVEALGPAFAERAASHDAEDRFVAARNLPDALADARFYEPTREGAEAPLADRLADWRRRRAKPAR